MDLMELNDAGEAVIEDEDYNGDTAFDSETCALCSDVVIDRGVLDCCSHWFCFACIDKWAAITSSCPICKKEFQLITCLPVFDTIGNKKIEEHPFPRDDDWRVQGYNNTLSFPSYYIDEDAVVCLDGDGCKIRSGLVASEEDLIFDTSIACDSCDIWYHAFCVEFNPGLGNENSWLCPRCIGNGVQQKSDEALMQGKQFAVTDANLGWAVDQSFSQKVSVSVADSGETAVIVSLVEGKPKIAKNKGSSEELDFHIQDKTETSVPNAAAGEGKDGVQFEKSDCFAEKGSIANAIHNKNTSEILLVTSPEMAGDQTEADMQRNLFAIQSIPDPEPLMTLHPPYRDVSETPSCLSLSVATYADPKVDGTETTHLCDFQWNNFVCSDGKPYVVNASQSSNSSKILVDVSPGLAGVQTVVDLEAQDSAHNVAIVPPNKDMTETSPAPSLSLATHGNPRASYIEGTNNSPYNFDDYRISFSHSFQTSSNMTELSEGNCCFNLPGGLPRVSSLSVDKEVVHTAQNVVRANKECSLELSSLPEDKMDASAGEELIVLKDPEVLEVGTKLAEKFQSHDIDVDHLNKRTRKRETVLLEEMEADYHVKKTKSEHKSKSSPSRCKVNSIIYGKSQRSCRSEASPIDASLTYDSQRQANASDIMSIVKETGCGFNLSLTSAKSGGIEKRNNGPGLRVKKIMRRAGDEKESSMIVQMLRREIQDAVQDKNSKTIDKDSVFDANLLTAFRAALVKPKNNLVNKSDSSLIGVRKPPIQKGKIRDNLTKKIYSSSTGRRRRTCDRDREIEFWKHRCKRMKPEKVETLQSVLEFLKKAVSSCSENSEIDQGPEEPKSSILSRVYLADASVFPRKDDIKPLSALAGCSLSDNLGKDKIFHNQSMRDSKVVHETSVAKNLGGVPMVSSVVSSSGKTVKRSCTLSEASCTQVNGSSGSKGREHDLKERADLSSSGPSDKRKWAMEVLARKNALTNLGAAKEKQEDSTALKGNYPLLVQLPMDMRPVPTPIRNSKVSVSVRQAQLYRIAEHYLRRANLPVMRRTAKTELAIVDAVNIEKDILERSNSKLVYMNLCSQFISQLDKKPQSARCDSFITLSAGTDQASSRPVVYGCSKVEEALKLAGLSDSSPNGSCRIVENANEQASSEPEATSSSKVEAALKLAGLSDSPSNSPRRIVEDSDEQEQDRVNARGEVFDSVLDIDNHPDMDIYGDFEYDLEDEGYTAPSIAVSALAVSKIQPGNGDSRMKVVLSTLKHDPPRPQICEADGDGCDNLGDIKVPSQPSTSLECKKVCKADAFEEVMTSDPPFEEPYRGEIFKDLSVAECEELYGPEKEPVVKSVTNYEVIGGPNNVEMESADDKAENHKMNVGTTMFDFEAEAEGCAENSVTTTPSSHESQRGKGENILKEQGAKITIDKTSISAHFVSKKVEAYVKEHIRPLCKSGVITAEQYKWAVRKSTEKVMKHHHKDKNANFLIKEGEKVKKLAEQYVETAQQRKMD